MMPLSDSRIRLEIDGPLAVITLCRPEKLNALDRPIAIETVKLLINAAEQEEAAAAMQAMAGGLVARTQDLREGVTACREKRAAVFGGGA